MPDEVVSAGSGDTGVGTLEEDVGAEVYSELRGEFLAYLSQQAAQLAAAAEAGDVTAAQAVAHQIKGTASSFGAIRLDELAMDLMQIADTQVELLDSIVRDICAQAAALRGAVSL